MANASRIYNLSTGIRQPHYEDLTIDKHTKQTHYRFFLSCPIMTPHVRRVGWPSVGELVGRSVIIF